MLHFWGNEVALGGCFGFFYTHPIPRLCRQNKMIWEELGHADVSLDVALVGQ